VAVEKGTVLELDIGFEPTEAAPPATTGARPG